MKFGVNVVLEVLKMGMENVLFFVGNKGGKDR